ncbi:MAG: hypothetical protein ACFBSC_13175 [Microcoleaceae cyanobacterium]
MFVSQPKAHPKSSRVWTIKNIIILAITLGSATAAVSLVLYGCIKVLKWATPATASIAPTSIPWITNQYDCSKTGRYWKDGQCWDADHDHMF